MQAADDAESRKSSGGGGALQEQEGRKKVKVGPEPGGQHRATVADTACAAAPDQVGSDVLMEKLKAMNMSLYNDLVLKWRLMLMRLLTRFAFCGTKRRWLKRR